MINPDAYIIVDTSADEGYSARSVYITAPSQLDYSDDPEGLAALASQNGARLLMPGEGIPVNADELFDYMIVDVDSGRQLDRLSVLLVPRPEGLTQGEVDIMDLVGGAETLVPEAPQEALSFEPELASESI